MMEAKRTHLGAQDPPCQTRRREEEAAEGAMVNLVELLMLEVKPEYEPTLN